MISPRFKPKSVLIIEDEEMLRLTLGDHLKDQGIEVFEADNGQRGLELYYKHKPALITLDLKMPLLNGHEVLSAIRQHDLDIPVIIISGQGQFNDVVQALKNGASDYLEKPIADLTLVDHAIAMASERIELRNSNISLSKAFLNPAPQNPEHFNNIITHSSKMLDIFRYCEAISSSPEPVLITGETGVGKELLAHAMHRASGSSGKFVALNVAGLDDVSFSDTLFGHVRGAYTGADTIRAGLIEKASNGTLFLDEIGDLDTQSQIKLLRVIQEREFYPLGSDSPKPLRARILAATNIQLTDLKTSESFRRDLYFRLATHTITIPSLHDRPEDIQPLFKHFLYLAAKSYGREVPSYSREVLAALSDYEFPGNIRELRALVFDALGRSSGNKLNLNAFPSVVSSQNILRKADNKKQANPFAAFLELPTIRAATRFLIDEAMIRSGGVQKKAAALLGISPQALSERIKRNP